MFTKKIKKSTVVLPESTEDPEVFEAIVKRQKIEKKPESSLFEYTDEIGLKAYRNAGVTPDTEAEHETISNALKQKEISNKIYKGDLDSAVYRGQKAYALYAEKSDATILASKYTGSLGPVKAPSHVRSTCRFDYAYGLCKDWKVSGYCGYGDSCIFVHDRSEFKTGWELEKEWEKDQEEKRQIAFREKEASEGKKTQQMEEKEKEKACVICKEGLIEVSTQCKHEFCYKCCLEQFGKSQKCYVCGKDTKGIFNEIKAGIKD